MLPGILVRLMFQAGDRVALKVIVANEITRTLSRLKALICRLSCHTGRGMSGLKHFFEAQFEASNAESVTPDFIISQKISRRNMTAKENRG